MQRTRGCQRVRKSQNIADFEDDELAVDLAAGVHAALSPLFYRHRAWVFRTARHLLDDDGEAEDTVQQVFLDLWLAARQFDPARGRFKSWFLQFAYHRVLRRMEHLEAKRFYNTEVIDKELEESTPENTIQPYQLAQEERRRLAHELLKMLSDPERKVVELRVLHGFSQEEVAIKTGKSLSVVRNTLHRALTKMRSILETANGNCRKRGKDNVRQAGIIVSKSRKI